MRSLSLLSVTFAFLFSTSSAEAYFRVTTVPTVKTPVRVPAYDVEDWPEWLGMPEWMYDAPQQSTRVMPNPTRMTPNSMQTTAPAVQQTDATDSESWPLWIDRPNWLK